MSTLAPTLQTFFTQRLLGERQASPHTVAAYRDTFRLLLAFTTARLGKAPSQLLLTVFPASRRFQTVPSRIAAARLALMPGGRQRRAPPTAGGG